MLSPSLQSFTPFVTFKACSFVPVGEKIKSNNNNNNNNNNVKIYGTNNYQNYEMYKVVQKVSLNVSNITSSKTNLCLKFIHWHTQQ